MSGDPARPVLLPGLKGDEERTAIDSRRDRRLGVPVTGSTAAVKWVEVRFEELRIPGARGPSWELPEHHQVGNAQFGGSELNRPRQPMVGTWWSLLTAPTLARLVMRWLVGEPSGRRSRWWWPVPVRLPVWGDDRHAPKNYVLYDILRSFGRRFYGRNLRAGDAFAPHLPIRHVRLGDDELVGLPVEPSAVLTQRIRAALRPDAPEEVVLLGLCGGYAGYATTSDEYRVQDYEGAATLWGRDFGRYVQAMVERVASGSARPPGMAQPGEASFDTDPREAGSPISLHVPPRAMQPFTGTPEVTLGHMPPGARRLAPFEEPDRPVAVEGDAELSRLADEVASDAERLLLWGWWFSEPPASTERAVPLAEGWIVRLEHRTDGDWQDLCWGPCVVDDRDVSFFLRRAVSADLTRVRWIMSVRLPCDLLPDGTEVRLRVADRPGIRPLAGSVVRSWAWSREGDGVLEGG